MSFGAATVRTLGDKLAFIFELGGLPAVFLPLRYGYAALILLVEIVAGK